MSEIDRVMDFLRTAEERVCDVTRPTPHGTALVTEALPLVWALNALRVEDPDATAEQLVTEAEQAQSGLGHRKLVVHDQQVGARLAPALARRGWNVFRLLVMVRRRDPDRPAEPGLAGEVDHETASAALATFRREQPFGWQEQAIEQLAAMDARYTRALAARDFVAPVGEPAASCRLYTNGGVGQIDEVGTLAAHRGRGFARAAVLAAAEAAAGGGCDPTFLLTDAGDWPQELYRRLGFDQIGCVYEFLKLPLGSARP
jgi:GNAT superfamily N-acetyltransferase